MAAADRDDSVNGVVTYSLDPQSARFFSIDAATGRITTTAAFDREVTPVITLTVYAVDSGGPALTGTASVSVTIADVNDNPPYGVNPQLFFQLVNLKNWRDNIWMYYRKGKVYHCVSDDHMLVDHSLSLIHI